MTTRGGGEGVVAVAAAIGEDWLMTKAERQALSTLRHFETSWELAEEAAAAWFLIDAWLRHLRPCIEASAEFPLPGFPASKR